jgi:hypothetical protein
MWFSSSFILLKFTVIRGVAEELDYMNYKKENKGECG